MGSVQPAGTALGCARPGQHPQVHHCEMPEQQERVLPLRPVQGTDEECYVADLAVEDILWLVLSILLSNICIH